MSTASDTRPVIGRRTSPGILVMVAVVAILGGSWAWGVIWPEDPRHRIESEHALTLPASADDFQAMGDGSVLISSLRDGGASSIFVMDRAELGDLLSQAPFGPLPVPVEAPPQEPGAAAEAEWVAAQEPASWIPVDGQYQPKSVPWDASSEPEDVLFTDAPPNSADGTVIELYPIPGQPDRVGVWIYSDWN